MKVSDTIWNVHVHMLFLRLNLPHCEKGTERHMQAMTMTIFQPYSKGGKTERTTTFIVSNRNIIPIQLQTELNFADIRNGLKLQCQVNVYGFKDSLSFSK